MKKITMKNIIGVGLLIGGIIFALWLAFGFMLYGGIMQAVNSWGVDNSAVAWGIIRAIFAECGLIPGGIVFLIGCAVLDQ